MAQWDVIYSELQQVAIRLGCREGLWGRCAAGQVCRGAIHRALPREPSSWSLAKTAVEVCFRWENRGGGKGFVVVESVVVTGTQMSSST